MKRKGDKDQNGSTYKVDLHEINPIKADDTFMKQFERLRELKEQNEKLIKKHNNLIRVREVAATIPDEYLRSVNLDRLIDVDDTRRLIIKGCEKEIQESKDELTKMGEVKSSTTCITKKSKKK